jgi:hypothetical protein
MSSRMRHHLRKARVRLPSVRRFLNRFFRPRRLRCSCNFFRENDLSRTVRGLRSFQKRFEIFCLRHLHLSLVGDDSHVLRGGAARYVRSASEQRQLLSTTMRIREPFQCGVRSRDPTNKTRNCGVAKKRRGGCHPRDDLLASRSRVGHRCPLAIATYRIVGNPHPNILTARQPSVK